MRYPYINKRGRQEVLVPQLSGGLNLRDGVSGIADNQLTEVKNFWFKNGMLRTRPPFTANVASVNSLGNANLKSNVRVKFHPEIKVNYNGEDCVLSSSKMLIDDLESGESYYVLNFQFESNNKNFVLPSITGIAEDVNYFLAGIKGVIYCYLSDCSIWQLEYEEGATIGSQTLEWKRLSENDMYVPTVMAHCNRSGMWDFSGTQLNGFNLLCGKYKMIYSAYNELDSDSTHPMKYGYLKSLPKGKHIKITVKLTSQIKEGERFTAKAIEHTIYYYRADDNDVWVRESLDYGEAPEDGLYLYTKKDRLEFFESDTSQIAYALDTPEKKERFGQIEDNIEITAYYDTNEEERKKVFCQTQAVWFGGSANGINGGSRLFLCGNTEKSEKALVIWSGLNNPLYFGENCYTYVGNNSSAVTALGRQEEKLIIFKENEIYYTYYAANDSITAEDLINQTVVDYEANSVYFPIVTLNGNIGCDCPKTVQMCRNRLVWANSDGRIYTLCTVNQYNENTVYEISKMISDALRDKKELLKNAASTDFEGHYILFLGNCAWVCDYNSYGYQYVYSYSKGEDANLKIPWYYWEFPYLSVDEKADSYTSADVCVLSGELFMRTYYNASTLSKKMCVTYRMNGGEAEENDKVYENDFISKRLKLSDKKIECSFSTKLFDFGLLDYYKNIEAVKLMLGVNKCCNTRVKFITDVGEEVHNIFNIGKDSDENVIDYVKPRVIRPSVKAVLRFGIKFEGEGQVLTSGIRLVYRILGGVK